MRADGKVISVGDRIGVRWERRLRHPPEKVWRAITEAKEMKAWFPSAVLGDRRTGATLKFDFGDPTMPLMEGKVIAWDPPRLFEYTWGDDLLRFELTPLDGGCLLVFTTVLPDRAEASRNATGWQMCLANLTRALDGEPSQTGAADWPALFTEYQEMMGLGDFPKFVKDSPRVRFISAKTDETIDEQLSVGAYLAVMEGTATVALHGIELTLTAGKEFVAPPGKIAARIAQGSRVIYASGG